MSIFIVSDTHFNHFNIIEYSGRPFALDQLDGEDDYEFKRRSVDHMNKALVAQWQSVVGPKDDVYHLGDFAFENSYGWSYEDIFDQLPGNKHLIIGNHDDKSTFDLGWVWVKNYHEIRLSKTHRAVLFHYPIESWNRAARGQIHIHGHCHGTLKRSNLPHRFDAGVDAHGKFHNYGPIPIEYFFDLADAQEFESQDHHGD